MAAKFWVFQLKSFLVKKRLDSYTKVSLTYCRNLAKNVSRLRKILNADGIELIETLPKRGYRFLADIKRLDGETSLLVHRRMHIKITQTDTELTNGAGV